MKNTTSPLTQSSAALAETHPFDYKEHTLASSLGLSEVDSTIDAEGHELPADPMDFLSHKQLNVRKIDSRSMAAWWVLLAVCALLAIFGASCKKKEKEVRPVAEVEVALPLTDSVVIYQAYPATLGSESQADVVSRVNGQITGKYFEDGANVSKGQLLYTIESTSYSASASEAKAQLESALSQLEYATSHLRALEGALKDGAVAEMDVLQARTSQLQAEASVNQARAQLRNASDNLGHCRVTAPISGKISASLYDVGAYVNGEGAAVKMAQVFDDSNLNVEFSIPETELNSIRRNMGGFGNDLFEEVPVLVGERADGDFHNSPVKAKIFYQSPSIDPTAGNLRLKGTLIGKIPELRSGMYAKVMLPIDTDPKAILVRDASISTDQRGKYLYTVNDSNRVVYTPIVTGELYNDTLRMVKSGLKPGVRYVTRAMISVRNGEKIKPRLAK